MPPDSSKPMPPGLPARLVAAQALSAIWHKRQPLDRALDFDKGIPGLRDLEERDRALVRMLVAKSLRHIGRLRVLIAQMLKGELPPEAQLVEILLLLGATQILFLDVPDHAAVDLSVELANRDRTARRYAGLVNAVLRRITREGKKRIAQLDIALDTPPWRMQRWRDAYGDETALKIVKAHAIEPALDLTVKENVQDWAKKFQALLLPTGSIRLVSAGSVAALEGYDEGAWWVQDAAAALPAKLLGDIKGKTVADLCAAPGGKTAQLIAAGANVAAVDRSSPRLDRLRSNLTRLKFSCEIIKADAATWADGPFDAVLLDAPCTATGTIRRNPDLPWLQEPADLARLAALQARILDNAVKLLRPEGILVYATCSLEPEECERQIEDFLRRHSNMRHVPIRADEVGGVESFVTTSGDLRTFPFHLPNQDARLSGCDGFYAARLQRRS
jgi:16S rRNA (cytosine967-C5)-methyltransferase